MKFHKLIASFFGIGYIGKGGGTVAAAVACLIWYLTGAGNYWNVAFTITVIVTLIGVWSADKVESIWGHDSNRIVIDEVAGMLISLLWLPVNWRYALMALTLFRLFDIMKPLFIRRMEKLKGGWGVMMDDVLAGIYANVLAQIVVYFHWL